MKRIKIKEVLNNSLIGFRTKENVVGTVVYTGVDLDKGIDRFSAIAIESYEDSSVPNFSFGSVPKNTYTSVQDALKGTKKLCGKLIIWEFDNLSNLYQWLCNNAKTLIQNL